MCHGADAIGGADAVLQLRQHAQAVRYVDRDLLPILVPPLTDEGRCVCHDAVSWAKPTRDDFREDAEHHDVHARVADLMPPVQRTGEVDRRSIEHINVRLAHLAECALIEQTANRAPDQQVHRRRDDLRHQLRV